MNGDALFPALRLGATLDFILAACSAGLKTRGLATRGFRVERRLKSRRDAVERLPEFFLRQPAPARHHARAALSVSNVVERVGVEQHEVGALSLFDGAKVV